MTHSVDFRRHVLSIREKEGLTFLQTSKRFAVGVSSLVRWNKQLEPKATREGRPRKIDLEALAKDVAKHPDSYQYERAQRFGVTNKPMWLALRKLGVSYKKKPIAPQGGRRQTAYLPSKD